MYIRYDDVSRAVQGLEGRNGTERPAAGQADSQCVLIDAERNRGGGIPTRPVVIELMLVCVYGYWLSVMFCVCSTDLSRSD